MQVIFFSGYFEVIGIRMRYEIKIWSKTIRIEQKHNRTHLANRQSSKIKEKQQCLNKCRFLLTNRPGEKESKFSFTTHFNRAPHWSSAVNCYQLIQLALKGNVNIFFCLYFFFDNLLFPLKEVPAERKKKTK